MERSAEVTRWLADWRSGDRAALERLMPVLYDHLRGEARRQLAHERREHTLQATALVHEAWVDLAREERHDWQSRAHFLAVAGLAMRRVLVDHAVRRRAQKRDGQRVDFELDELVPPVEAGSVDWIELDVALERLSRIDERKSRVVELRFFAGLEHEEIARLLEVSERTIERDWRLARAWLHRELEAGAVERATARAEAHPPAPPGASGGASARAAGGAEAS